MAILIITAAQRNRENDMYRSRAFSSGDNEPKGCLIFILICASALLFLV